MKLIKNIIPKKIHDGFISLISLKVTVEGGLQYFRDIMTREGDVISSNSVAALVYDTEKDKYIFTQQFRPGLYRDDNPYLIELVAGSLEKNEDPAECMTREIKEELGYETTELIEIGTYYLSPGGSDETITLFLVSVKSKVAAGGGLATEHEDIDIIEMSESEMLNFKFRDLKTEHLVNCYYHGGKK